MTLALFKGKRFDVTVSGGSATPAELLRLNLLCPVVSAGFRVRKSESLSSHIPAFPLIGNRRQTVLNYSVSGRCLRLSFFVVRPVFITFWHVRL